MQKKTILLIISLGLGALFLFFLWQQRQPDWMTYVQQTIAKQEQEQFEVHDKFGEPVSLEWEMSSSQSSKFTQKMKSISDVVVQAYTPVEMRYVQKHPEAVSHDFMFKELESLFEQGIEKVNWKTVENHVKAKLKQLIEVDFANIFGANTLNIFVVAKNQKTQKQLGVALFLTNPDCAYGDVNVPVFGIIPEAQHRGIGKLLLSSIFRLIPAVKRIVLSTRITNEQAINAYKSWGFTDYPAWTDHEKGWVGFEYRTDKSNILQKTASRLID